jgi:predicted CopG family antitoxin
MGKRINIMIDDDTWRMLGKIPAGARSRTVNDALRAWVVRRRRNDAVRELDELRTQLPVTSTAEVAQWIRDEREQGH